MIISAGPVQLRPVEESDADVVAAMMTPAISHWVLSWPAHLTRVDAAERIARVRADANAGYSLYCVIERLPDRLVVGWISITRSRDDLQRGALGYWLGEAYQGHGYMTAAARAMRRVAFDELRRRNESEQVGQFVTALQQGEELGSPIAETLMQIAQDMRRTDAQNARRRAARAVPSARAKC